VGASPFRQKGNGYVGDFAYFDKVIPGGKEAVFEAIPAGPLRTFLQQKFRGSDWYDAYPCAAMHAAAARLKRQTFEQFRSAVGVYHAHEAGGGIYRSLLRVVSNENIAYWAPRMSTIYFEFAKVETRVEGPRSVAGTIRNVPAGLVQFTVFAGSGFTEETLRIAGGSAPRFEVGAVEPDGTAHGQALFRIAMKINWS
jgi:hypothetical protein